MIKHGLCQLGDIRGRGLYGLGGGPIDWIWGGIPFATCTNWRRVSCKLHRISSGCSGESALVVDPMEGELE